MKPVLDELYRFLWLALAAGALLVFRDLARRDHFKPEMPSSIDVQVDWGKTGPAIFR